MPETDNEAGGSTVGGSEEKRAWVTRVLQVSLGGTGGPNEALQRFKEAIDYVSHALPQFAQGGDGAKFAARLAAAQELFGAKNLERGLPEIEALRAEVAAALSGARGAQAAQVAKGSVARAKLALEVRRAHAAALQNLQDMGKKLLAIPEVQQDEQLPEVETALRRLANLIPPLDNALAQALDRYDAAESADDRVKAGSEAMPKLRGLQRKLEGSTMLRQIERFAAADLGGLKIAQDLRGALADAGKALQRPGA
jgi:hypothetical protein